MSDTKTPAPVHPLLEGTTPGPWRISTANPLAINSDQGEESVGIATTHCDMDGVFPRRNEAEANAKLIAMAPTLAAENARLRDVLEALVKSHEWAIANPDSPVSANINYGHVATDAREVLASLTT
jgi:hypothetical protein